MDFLSIQGGSVKQGKMAELQQWLAAHEPELRDACPKGSEYVGTYVTIYGSEKGLGDVLTLIRMDSYGAQDALAAAHGTRWGELVEEYVAFIDQSSTATDSNLLLKRLTDATLWGDA